MDDPTLEAPVAPQPTADELLAELRQPSPSAASAAPEDPSKPPRIDWPELWSRIDAQLSDGRTRLTDGSIQIELKPNELAYIRKVIRNGKIDEWRKNQRYYKRHESITEREEANRTAEANDEDPPFPDPCARATDDPATALELAEYRAAEDQKHHQLLLGLPIQLAVIAHVLPRIHGNVSELARQLGQPQRQTARQVERLREYLVSKGLGA